MERRPDATEELVVEARIESVRGHGGGLVWAPCLISVALAGLSYAHIADPATNDFERFEDLRLTFAFFALFLLWIAWWIALATNAELQQRLARRWWPVFFLTSMPLLFSFPVGSRDVFAYAFYGKMWAVYGIEPARTPPTALAQDSWFPMLQAWWKEGAAGYGPLFLLQTRLIGWLSGESLTAAVALYKLVNLSLLLGSVFLVIALSGEGPATRDPGHLLARDGRPVEAILWATNPLVLFESLSSAHNDLAMAVLVLAALRSWRQGAGGQAAMWWTLSVWFKWYSIVLLPFWLIAWWRRDGTPRMLRALWRAGAASLAATVMVLLPFGDAAWEILGKPATIEVGARLMPTEFPPTLWLLFEFLVVRAPWPFEAGRFLFDGARYTLLFAGWGLLLWRQWSRTYCFELLVRDFCLAILLLFGFAVTVLWPWHLLLPSALAVILHGGLARAAVVTISVIGLLSYFLTFPLASVAVLAGAAYFWVRERGSCGRVFSGKAQL